MKAKTFSSLSKRVRLNPNGRIMRKHAAASHLRVNKSPRSGVQEVVARPDRRRIRRMLPNG